MAAVTHERPEAPPTFTLVLTEEEALYIYSALTLCNPRPLDRFGALGDDPVYDALSLALDGAGVGRSVGYASRG